MDKNMGINIPGLKNLNEKKNIKREMLINSFIKKFPKVKLDTIISINKYYIENYEIECYEKKITSENQIINDYLTS